MPCPGEPLPSSSSPDGSPPVLVCFLLFALLLGAGVATIPVPAQWGGEQGLLPGGGACPLPLSHAPQPCDSVCKPSSLWGGVPRGDDGTFQDRGASHCLLGPTKHGLGTLKKAATTVRRMEKKVCCSQRSPWIYKEQELLLGARYQVPRNLQSFPTQHTPRQNDGVLFMRLHTGPLLFFNTCYFPHVSH